MQTGAITGYIDVAQLVLYAFWIFFAGLVYYLRREDKREGYPLQSDRSARAPRVPVQGFPPMPRPKIFRLAHGGSVSAPSGRADTREVKARPVAAWPGAPLEPTGDPMLEAVGPAAYAERADEPDLTLEGEPKIVPLGLAAGFYIPGQDPDPRGMQVIAGDGKSAGSVVDVWVDRSESLIRYLQVELAGGSRVLLPINFARIDGMRRRVRVQALHAAQFASVPATARPDRITLREEDRIMGYYGGGTLYAEPRRLGPWL
jgi:photosynthetic reaction center H subunit